MSKVDLADDRFGRRYQGGGAGISVVALHDGVDLTLLVHAQPDGIVGRVEVGPDDVARLLDEEGAVGGLEVALAVRLHAEQIEPALHGGLGDADVLGHGAHAPMRAEGGGSWGEFSCNQIAKYERFIRKLG